MNAEGGQTTTIDLEPGSEWRFELEADEDIAVRVSPLSSRCRGHPPSLRTFLGRKDHKEYWDVGDVGDVPYVNFLESEFGASLIILLVISCLRL